MAIQSVRNSPRSRLLGPVAAATLSLAPLALAQSSAPASAPAPGKPPAFTIVSVRPHGDTPGGTEGCNIDSCRYVDRPLRAFIMVAYDLSDKHLVGGPSWEDSDRFDLEAKIDPADLPATPLSSRQLGELLQPVLADQFQLRVHHETRTFPVYNLVLAKQGLKMTESAPFAPVAPGSFASPRRCLVRSKGNGLRSFDYCAMNDITKILEGPSGRSVIDKTGLVGHYDFELHWSPSSSPAESSLDEGSVFTAVQEQLGLKLEPSTAPLDVLVIDSAEKPTPN